MVHTLVQWLAVAAMAVGIYFLSGPWWGLLFIGFVALVTSVLTERAQVEVAQQAAARARHAQDGER